MRAPRNILLLMFFCGLYLFAVGPTTDDRNPQQSPGVTSATPATAQPASASTFGCAEAVTEYRISQHDILEISVFQINDFNSAVQVSQDGNITLPLIGKFEVAGKTTSEAEQLIAGKLRQKYFQSPQVSVSVKTYDKSITGITVSGAVGCPQVLADDGNTTLSQAIAKAGGVGNSQRVHIARSKDQYVRDEVYNLDDIQAGKVPDPLLKGGDFVWVEQWKVPDPLLKGLPIGDFPCWCVNRSNKVDW
jgi:protein involved in polysaccharide export with SLBB domain